ncbi:MAG: DUF4968 domain-containing protein, partial [Dysgonamonadaceae bacterium]|nr:DUF4968 domain-containing protein [Dysgonamonadaceae bacterium]
MKKIVLLITLFVSAQLAAQDYREMTNGIKTTINTVDIEIQFVNPATVRILKAPRGFQYAKESLSVNEKPQQIKLITRQQDGTLKMKSSKLEVHINLISGAVSFFTPGGKPLFKEKESGEKFTAFNDAGAETYRVKQSFILDREEAIYGLGIL